MSANRYKYSKKAGALQDAFEEADVGNIPLRQTNMMSSLDLDALPNLDEEVAQQSMTRAAGLPQMMLGNIAQGTAQAAPAEARLRRDRIERGGPRDENDNGLDRSHEGTRQYGMFFYTVEDGQRVLVVSKGGDMTEVEGPRRIWRYGKKIRPMRHHVAHPGDFLIVRYRDGGQEHMPGPAHVWLDPRVHIGVEKEEVLPISAKEAVVVYSEDEETGKVTRRIEHGPAQFVPEPGEWLHTFSWHGSAPSADGYRKIPNAMVFQKLWLMPDQMYHDVMDVRTADDAVLTIRLMIFFELRDIDEMLATTHDPTGDFINAATADVIEFMSRHDFESFKSNTAALNRLETYAQLVSRASQCGYHIDKVVYRGYGAPARLQQMHDQAIESRTRLGLERATEQQAQELEDFKLERKLERNAKARSEEALSQTHALEMEREREQARLEGERVKREFEREQRAAEAAQRHEHHAVRTAHERAHLTELGGLGVDLTALLTQGRADKVIELRGPDGQPVAPHLHIDRD